MPYLLAKSRGLGAFIAAAVLGALLAAGSPAAAEVIGNDTTAEPDALPTASACVGNALNEHGFEDISSLADDYQDAINCIAHYGITRGTTLTTYSPSSDVTRSQMALFLYRTAQKAKVEFDLTEYESPFTDIDGLDGEWRKAVDSLHSKGIMFGRSGPGGAFWEDPAGATFVPSADINRAEMAHYLRNLLKVVNTDLFDRDGTLLDVDGNEIEGDDLDEFADTAEHVPTDVETAIRQVYELGITVGTRDNSEGHRLFEPAGTVPRSNMALFITRLLAHTDLRPTGLSAQWNAETGELNIAIRDADGLRVKNAPVDVFYSDEEAPFADNGTCIRRDVEPLGGGTIACEMERYLDITDTDGNLVVPIDRTTIGEGINVWVWSDAPRAQYDNTNRDQATVRLAIGKTEAPAPEATRLAVSVVGVTDNATHVAVGESVTVVLQAQGLTLTGETIDVNKPRGVHTYNVTHKITATTPCTQTRSVELGKDGSIEFDIPGVCSDALIDGDYTYEVTVALTGDHELRTISYPDDDTKLTVQFSEAAAVPTHIAVEARNQWFDVSEANNVNFVTITVTDQYGDGMSDIDVTLTSDAAGWAIISPAENKRTTNRRGELHVRYRYPGTAAVTETLSATATYDVDGTPTTLDMRDGATFTDMVYWAGEAAEDSADDAGYDVLYWDKYHKVIVVDVSSTPHAVSYDDYNLDRDSFDVSDSGLDRAATTAERLEAFEVALAKVNDPDDDTSYKLTWNKPPKNDWEFTLTLV